MSNWKYCEQADKVSFGSERSAKQAARNLMNANRGGFTKDRLHPYRCGNHWHIGHDYRGSSLEPLAKRRSKDRQQKRVKQRA
jgi:hypothetical protein